MVLVPKRSWLGVFFALYVHLWRAHRKLRSTPEEFSYAQLSAPLLDAQVHDLEAGERRIRAVATPPGWSGKTVVLVHDLKMRLETWSLVWEQLREQGHRLIAADLAGHGESTLTPGSLELSSLSMDLERLLEYFHVTEGAVVGHGVGGFIAVQFLLEHRLAARRLPFGLVCVSCTAGNLQKAVGREFLRTLATAFAALRLPELLTYFDLPGEASVARRLGQNATHGVVRVALEAKRRAASDWALRNLSDALWTLDLHPSLATLRFPCSVLLSRDDRVQPEALREAFAATGQMRYFKLLDDAGSFLPLIKPKEVAEAVSKIFA